MAEFELVEVEVLEEEVRRQIGLCLRTSSALREITGRNVAASAVLPVPGVVEGFLDLWKSEGKGRTIERLADAVADVVLERLHADPSLVASLSEFGEVGVALAQRLGVPDYATEVASLRRDLGGEPAQLFMHRDQSKRLQQFEGQVAQVEHLAAMQGLRADMLAMAQAMAALAAREAPALEVTVEPAPVDVAALSSLFVAGVAPTLAGFAAAIEELATALNAGRSRSVTVERGRAGEITNLSIREG